MQYETGREWLNTYLRKYRWRLAAGTLFVFISVGFGVFVPHQVGVAIDDLGAGVSYDFNPRISATLQWDSNDFRFAGTGRDPVRSTSLGLQIRY